MILIDVVIQNTDFWAGSASFKKFVSVRDKLTLEHIQSIAYRLMSDFPMPHLSELQVER